MEKKTRKGFSLIELLVAIIVLGILAAMLVNSGINAQKRARVTAAITVLKDYEHAFSSACLTHPGVMSDREDSWGADGSTYSTKDAMSRIVGYMNEALDHKSMLTWNSTTNRYESVGEDPWGGKYVLTEFPLVTATDTANDPTIAGGVAESAMRLSIWATGNNDSINAAKVVAVDSIGITLEYKGGYVLAQRNGVDEQSPFVDYIIP